MFDINNSVGKRYFTVKIGEVVIDVEPPKKKVLSKIMSLSKDQGSEAIDGIYEAAEMILSKNKTGYKVPQETIDDMDTDQLQELLSQFFKWLTTVKNSPN